MNKNALKENLEEKKMDNPKEKLEQKKDIKEEVQNNDKKNIKEDGENIKERMNAKKNKKEEENRNKEEIKLNKKENIKTEKTKFDNENENKKLEERKTDNKKANKEKFKKINNKKELKKMNSEKKKRKWVIPAVIIGIVIVFALIFSTIFALININNEKIISGISIEGIEISGLSKEEAKEKIESLYNEKKAQEIKLKYQEYESTLSPTMMEVNYDIEKAINEAYLTGRKENIFVNNYEILMTIIAKKDINVDMSLNEDVTKQAIQDMQANLPGVVVESTYAVEDDELIITKGKEGICVDSNSLLNQIKERLNNINLNDNYIEIPVVNKKPQEIDIQKIHDEIYKEAQDAYYTKDPFTVYPEVVGVDFNVEEAKKILQEEKDVYVIPLTLTQPKVTISQIGTEAFPDRLSYFTTMYDPGDRDRSTNLRLACEKLNGKVIMPGETFSYNKTLGPRTVAAGYKNGKVYENGKVVDGIGGGICQISSTLYNAVLMANLEIVERRNHQFVTSYVGAGRDATVVYGVTDFKFKNTRTYPIRLVASSKNGVATISIFGIKEEKEYTFEFKTNRVSTIPFTTQYIEDNTLEAGKEVVEQKGTNGLISETYIIKKLDGKVVSTKLLSKDTYSAMTRIVRRGTKGATSTAPTTQPTTPTTPTETQPNTPANDPSTSTDTPSTENPNQGNTTTETEDQNPNTGSDETTSGE